MQFRKVPEHLQKVIDATSNLLGDGRSPGGVGDLSRSLGLDNTITFNKEALNNKLSVLEDETDKLYVLEALFKIIKNNNLNGKKLYTHTNSLSEKLSDTRTQTEHIRILKQAYRTALKNSLNELETPEIQSLRKTVSESPLVNDHENKSMRLFNTTTKDDLLKAITDHLELRQQLKQGFKNFGKKSSG